MKNQSATDRVIANFALKFTYLSDDKKVDEYDKAASSKI